MSCYISGIGFVTSQLQGCGSDVNTLKKTSGKLPCLSRKDVLDNPYKPFGRMDMYSKIGFAAIYFAFKDAGLLNHDNISNTAIIASTYLGCIDTDKNFFNTMHYENGKNASPALFAYTLPNTFLGEASIYLKTSGESFVINSNDFDGIDALKMSFDLLQPVNSLKSEDNGNPEFVLCGVCNTNTPDFLKNNENLFAGSLFFAISKQKQKLCYGKITQDENGNLFFNGKNIMNLFDLANASLKNNKIKL